MKAQEQVEWDLLKWWESRSSRNVFDDLAIVFLVVGGREMRGTR